MFDLAGSQLRGTQRAGHHSSMPHSLLLLFALFASPHAASAATPYDGYNLFQTLTSTTANLIDSTGSVVHSWATGYTPGNAMYLLDDGDLLHTGNVGNTTFQAGGAGDIVQRIDWNGNASWSYQYSSSTYLQHHDVELLPSGNILMVAWQYKSQSEAIAAGRDSTTLADGELWPDSVIEIEPNGSGGTIVWEWHVWDHLVQEHDASKANFGVVADHPELVDLNYAMNTKADWNHINSVDYNAELDQIVLSVHNFSEIWVIDHSTTTAQAASHVGGNSGKGGDLLYRWGNPQTYAAGSSADQKLFVQHDAEWIESGLPNAGNILIFNNGQGRPAGDYSTIEEVEPPLEADGSYTLTSGAAYGPDTTVWNYTAATPSDFYAQNISGQQRLPNGNTLICEGPSGNFFEVSSAGETVWSYNAGGLVFRVERYAPEYPGFNGTSLDGPDNVAPTANAGGPYSGVVGSAIAFDGSASSDSDGSIISYAWDFDEDGLYTDADGASIEFTFNTAGSYTIALQIRDDDAEIATAFTTVTVTADATSSSAIDGCPNGSDITISGYTYASGEVVVCDGKTSITAGPSVVVSSAASVTYKASGSITLNPGFQVSNQGYFRAVVDSSSTNQAPTANAGGPYSGEVSISISLDGSSSTDSDGTIVAYAWDLDDDGQYNDADGVSANFSSANAGTYTIGLQVTDEDGLSATDSTTVTITTSSAARTYAVVDTAQALCFSSSGTQQSCTGNGYDADYTGNAPNYTLNTEGTIVNDEVTGLRWTQTPDLDNDGDVDTNDKRTVSDAASYCTGITLGGYDWRLPNIKELYSLMDFRGTDPASINDTAETLTPFINDAYFQPGFGDTAAGDRIIDGQFASSTFYISPAGTINGGDTMFGVNFVDGRIKGYGYTSMQPGGDKTFYVLCVSGDTSYGVNNFTDNGNGTVSDAATGLMWEQADSSNLDFEEAVSHCESASTGSHADWRLPNVKELHSILDYTRAPDYTNSAAIDPVFDTTSFSNEEGVTDWGYYWSSTTHMNSLGVGSSGSYISFGRALGYFESQIVDVHGAGAQRSNNKTDVSIAPTNSANIGYGLFYYFGPQGDITRHDNMVRCVRDDS